MVGVGVKSSEKTADVLYGWAPRVEGSSLNFEIKPLLRNGAQPLLHTKQRFNLVSKTLLRRVITKKLILSPLSFLIISIKIRWLLKYQ